MTTEVILLQPVKNLGAEGDKVAVANGYARNFLLPQRLATPATLANVRQLDELKKRRSIREEEELKIYREQAEKIGKLTLSIPVATGPGGKLFGAVTSHHIADALVAAGLPIEHRRIELKQPIHALGSFDVDVKLHAQVSANLKFTIVSKSPGAEEAAAEAPAKEEKPRGKKARAAEAAAAPAKEEKPAQAEKPTKAAAAEKKSKKKS